MSKTPGEPARQKNGHGWIDSECCIVHRKCFASGSHPITCAQVSHCSKVLRRSFELPFLKSQRRYEDKRDMDVNNYTLEMRIKYCKDLRLLAEQIEEIKQGIIGENPARSSSDAAVPLKSS